MLVDIRKHLYAGPARRMRRVRQQALVAWRSRRKCTLEAGFAAAQASTPNSSWRCGRAIVHGCAPTMPDRGVAEEQACLAVPTSDRQRNDVRESFKMLRLRRELDGHGAACNRNVAKAGVRDGGSIGTAVG